MLDPNGRTQLVIDYCLPAAYTGPMRHRPVSKTAISATNFWVGLADSFEHMQGGRPYSTSAVRYWTRLVLTVAVCVGGIVSIRYLTEIEVLIPQIWWSYFIFAFLMKGKILVLFEPLFLRNGA